MEGTKEDIFTVLNVVFVVDRIIGLGIFSVIGSPGYRKLVIKKKSLLILTVKTIFGIYISFLLVHSRLNSISKYGIEHVPELSLLLACNLFFLAIPTFKITYRKRIIKIYWAMQKVYCYIKHSGVIFDYFSVKRYSLIIFGFKMFLTLRVILGYLEHGAIHIIFSLLFTYIVIEVSEAIYTSLLYCFYKMTVEINSNIPKTLNFVKNLEDAQSFLYLILNVHYDLYKSCVDMNAVYNYVILQFFISYTSVVYIAFKVAKDMATNLSLIWIFNAGIWSVFNVFWTAHVIWRFVAMKNEVRVLYSIARATQFQ